MLRAKPRPKPARLQRFHELVAQDAVHRAGVLKLLERLKRRACRSMRSVSRLILGLGGMGAATVLAGDADIVEWRKFLDAVTAMGLDLVVTESTSTTGLSAAQLPSAIG